MDGREAWQSVPKEASSESAGMCVDTAAALSFSLTPSSSLSDPQGIKQDRMITPNPLSAFCSALQPELESVAKAPEEKKR